MLRGALKSVGSRRHQARLLSAWLLIPAVAEPQGPGLAPPTGRVLLSVEGRLTVTNVSGRADLDRLLLEQLGMHGLTTSTAWTEGDQRFEGVLARDLLRAVGASGERVLAKALNDYMVEVPFERYPVLLALEHNGAYMRVRDKGPIWLVYPQDDHQELADPSMKRYWIWQLRSLFVQ